MYILDESIQRQKEIYYTKLKKDFVGEIGEVGNYLSSKHLDVKDSSNKDLWKAIDKLIAQGLFLSSENIILGRRSSFELNCLKTKRTRGLIDSLLKGHKKTIEANALIKKDEDESSKNKVEINLSNLESFRGYID